MGTSIPTRPYQKPPPAQWNSLAARRSRRRASEDDVRVRAFGIYELNGQQENHAGEDWLQAKRELRALGEDTVSCVRCTALLRTLRSAQRSYDAALTSTFYVVSKKLAARKQVDMERAKDELFEHQRICRRPSLPLRGSAS